MTTITKRSAARHMRSIRKGRECPTMRYNRLFREGFVAYLANKPCEGPPAFRQGWLKTACEYECLTMKQATAQYVGK